MLNLFASKEKRQLKPAGSALIILNILRVCNIVSLLDVVVASWIMLVMTVKTSNFFFFDGVSHFITSTISLFLIISEFSLFKKYFSKNFPLLGPQSSLLFLGISMVAVGFNILGNLNKQATSVQALGLPLWRVVISSGVLTSVFGFLTIAANFWYRDTTNKQTARQMRSRYVQETLPVDAYIRPLSLPGTTYNPTEPMSRREKFMSRLPFVHKRSSTAPTQRFPVISGPYPHDESDDLEKMVGSKRGSFESDQRTYHEEPEVVEDRLSPNAGKVTRPPTALHPFHRNLQSGAENRYSASQYSCTTRGGAF